MNTFKFRCLTPITHIYETMGRLKDRGILVEAGTSHLYGALEAKDTFEAVDTINSRGWI